MSKAAVLDASALLCVLNGEQGSERVMQVLPAAVIGAANLAEVVSKLRERGLSVEEVEDVLGGLPLDVRPLSAAQAYAIGHLRPTTRTLGLSLGDRACLALAAELGMPALTADQAWASLDIGVAVELIRG
ncbi:MAG: type II toxin-antitoxin system VapC family toxin [Paracoccus sp. (in: a-proteobacteria)]|uniref:type II toxin-antitoxin system VapC family toxin n=1 Tax=Salipiger abyssi TaxID=1250539 RepID=UPI0040598FF2